MRIALVGVGNELFGDDAIGINLVKRVRALMPLDERVYFLEAGPSPENCCSALRKFNPHLVIFLDAAQMNVAPGEFKLIPLEYIDGFTWSTHTFPLSLLAQYLAFQLHCKLIFIGIQPAQMSLSLKMSQALENTINERAKELAKILTSSANPLLKRKVENEIHYN